MYVCVRAGACSGVCVLCVLSEYMCVYVCFKCIHVVCTDSYVGVCVCVYVCVRAGACSGV